MNDPAFLERLNLLIDGELPESQRAALLREIAADPQKLQVYRQYQRLQAASRAAFEGFRAEATKPRVEGNVIWLPRTLTAERRRSSAAVYARLAATAAACAVAILGPALLLDHVREPIAKAGTLQVASASVVPPAPAPQPAPASPRVAWVPDLRGRTLLVDVATLPNAHGERFSRGAFGERWAQPEFQRFADGLIRHAEYGGDGRRPVFANGAPAPVPAHMASFTFQR